MTERVTRPRRSCLSVPGSSPKMLAKAPTIRADEVFLDLEVQIETATGVTNIDDIAEASDRTETLIFGPADMSASLGLPALTAGLPMPNYPGDHWHYVLSRILVAARNAGLQAIDGPYLVIKDLDGFREMALRARALGYDGKWALHPGQIDVLNEVFAPSQEEFDKAEAVLEAYRHATDVQLSGAVMFGAEMIDEASRKMAEQLSARGRAAGLNRQKSLQDFAKAEGKT